MAGKLRRGDISLKELLILSRSVYGKGKIDNKAYRASLDVKSGRITARRNLTYNRKTKSWEQTGRGVKISLLIVTKPVSYKKTDTLDIHKFPVTFLFQDFSKLLDSPVRIRCGSMAKPTFPKKGISKEKRTKLINKDIKKMICKSFFFELENVYSRFGILHGPDMTSKSLPREKNPSLSPFLCKHIYWATTRVLIPLFQQKGGYLVNKLVKSE